MRRTRLRQRLRPPLVAAVACAAVLLTPGSSGSAVIARHFALMLPTISSTGQSFGGTAAVGALFSVDSGGGLGTHFCTASVVHSSHGDLAVTAAHCVTGNGQQMAFVPGYASGQEPYGVWTVTAVYTDQAWQSSQDPDDDVAFLQLSDDNDGVPIEAVTGAERFGTDRQRPAFVQVVAYPNGADEPVWCANWTKIFSPTQLEFDCGGYTQGTSGGPLLTHVSAADGQGTVVGVIGGYQQGGDTDSVSYAAALTAPLAALFQQAQAGG
jgi:V8-like Glu-specific endopeptidase